MTREFKRVLLDEAMTLGPEWRIVAAMQLENGLKVALVEKVSEAADRAEETEPE